MKTNKETLHMLNTSMVEDNLFALLQCVIDSGMGGTEIDLLIRILSYATNQPLNPYRLKTPI